MPILDLARLAITHPLLPDSLEVKVFYRLKHHLAEYRVVFSQPRQEKLVTLLDHSRIDNWQLAEWAVDLRRPTIISEWTSKLAVTSTKTM